METAAIVAMAASKLMSGVHEHITADEHLIACDFTEDQVVDYFTGLVGMSFYDKDADKVKADFKSCININDKFTTDMCAVMNKYSHGGSSDQSLLEGAEGLLKLIPDMTSVFPGDDCTDNLKHIYHWHEKWGKKWEWELKASQKFQFLVQGGECRYEATEITQAVNQMKDFRQAGSLSGSMSYIQLPNDYNSIDGDSFLQ